MSSVSFRKSRSLMWRNAFHSNRTLPCCLGSRQHSWVHMWAMWANEHSLIVTAGKTFEQKDDIGLPKCHKHKVLFASLAAFFSVLQEGWQRGACVPLTLDSAPFWILSGVAWASTPSELPLFHCRTSMGFLEDSMSSARQLRYLAQPWSLLLVVENSAGLFMALHW